MNPFDFWKGANFKLKIRNVEGYRNYDKSEFAEKSALLGGDDSKLEAIYKEEFSLKEFLERGNFKSYEQIKSRLDKVLGLDGAPAKPKTTVEQAKAAPRKAETVDVGVAEDDDDLAYFSKLAEE